MLPVRAAAASLDAAVTVNVDAPCPEVDPSFSHEASLAADQVQSRAALIVTETVPPCAGTAFDDVPMDAAHRTAPGAVTLVTEVDPQAAMMRTMRTVSASGMSGRAMKPRSSYG